MEDKTDIAARGKRLRHTGLIVFACAVLLAVVLALCLGGKGSGIALPAGSAELYDVTEQTGYQRTDANITVDNVQQVIASMRRPDAYTASVTNTLYWSGSWETIYAMQYVRDGVCLTGYFNSEGNMERYEAVKDDIYYAWRNGGATQYSGSAGTVSADDMSMIPTYETVVQEEKTDILAAGERTVNGEACIYVTVNDTDTGYSLTYWVSAVSGLLVQADYNRGSELVRSVVIDNIQQEEPMEALFLLPDGSSLLANEAE
ncbi:MAG: hypothetical protein LUE11_06115 [Clostridia bacterium]|nr:hypothetical protein [Clostridia bacterium]